ncbi:BON1-associated protein 2-like [Neltuma alba]|uniref:BON1-associated protein 2-like n=1 Tax=Neltuma alba TaxID=207710 RepID=UPI0010A535D4|nr:BON1-associated protein 2-like [Prosopis alba]
MGPIRTRTLEVSIISGENLCTDERNPVTANMCVVVRAESVKCWSTKMATQEAGSVSTLWNENLTVEMPWHAESMTLEVQSETSKGVVRSVGLARIAIADVMPKEQKCSGMLSYRLRNWDGRRSGVINFSVKLKNEEEEEKLGIMAGSCGAFGSGMDHHQELKLRRNSAIVTGIPVSWIHQGIPV